MTNLLRLVVLVLALPGRLLIRGIDDLKRSNGVPPLGRFLRGCVHGFLGLFALMAFAMSTMSPAPAPAASTPAPAASTPATVRPTPANSWAKPTPAPVSTAPSTAVDEPDEPVYVPLPDDEDDGESRFCRRRWWC